MGETILGDATPIGDPGSTARKLWVYGQLVRIEQHFTAQVQAQQARILSVLTVNGFLLGFLGSGAILEDHAARRWPAHLLLVSLLFLAVALLVGLGSLRPLLAIQRTSEPPNRGRQSVAHGAEGRPGLFLDEEWFVASGVAIGADEVLDRLCESTDNQPHRTTLARRRKLIRWQMLLISIAVLVLIVALVGSIFVS